MRKHFSKRLLSLLLVVALCVGLMIPAAASDSASESGFTVEKVDNSAVTATLPGREPANLQTDDDAYSASETVRVSIVLEKMGTIEIGFDPENIADNDAAMAYRDRLQAEQDAMVAKIAAAIGYTPNVFWKLTLAANIISAEVRFGDIAAIEALDGVEQVLIETSYAPCVVAGDEGADPNMATSSSQIGSNTAWAGGYTGAGSRIAIIDTGSDYDHQSLDSEAYEYSLSLLAEKAGMTYDAYVASLDLLDDAEIAGVMDKLNAADYISYGTKMPFGFNYVDGNINISHDYDEQGSHGSHVAGIATANAYIPEGDGFTAALDSVKVQGVAPDAQLITMKVFGEGGGAYDSDYMAAIEDAILLGCDAVNLSLGSGNPGMSRNSVAEYQQIMDSLVDSGLVAVMSAGNSGYWAEMAYPYGYLYLDDVSMQMDGSPGSYTNSLAVASVDNDGWIGYYVQVGESFVSYNETEYSNEPLRSLAGEQEYVFVNGIGTYEEFASVDVKDKIAMCYRGTTSFFEKAEAAVAAGAAGVIIVNNQAGVINMDLTDYTKTAPVVSILQADGEYFKTNAATTESGLQYWTGTMRIGSDFSSGQYGSEYYTMSAFSSWGVPGSLELKPEITAPGGSIYSINGVDTSGAAYEVMSGTSMAAPQVTGMVALAAQYIHESGLEAKTGLGARALAQSLLMSTAEPMVDGNNSGWYYPVIQQGAGLANIGNVIAADSYILMDDGATASAADGKVKAELGDDPEKTGTYSFSFTINNLTDEERIFALSADVFTQGAFMDNYGDLYMHTWTTSLNPTLTWAVNGQTVEAGDELIGRDINGDGLVNTADGQAILDYATGLVTELANEDKADMDADGDIDSYDAYLFFSLFEEAGAAVAPNGSAEVTVTIELSASDRAGLANYENGAYIEAYVYAQSLPTSEGVEGTSHSIPVLGFYGDWSDPSMYDKGSVVEYQYGMETRPPYLYGEVKNFNLMTVQYPDDTTEYIFGGNPFDWDDVYMPERNAISAESMLKNISVTTIRNAAEAYFVVKNVDTGEYLYSAPVRDGDLYSAYYYVNGAVWRQTAYNLKANYAPADVAEGTNLEMGLVLVPEYYVMNGKTYDFDDLGEGAFFTMNAVVDNTAPVLDEDSIMINEEAGTLTFDVTDNQYVAAVMLLDAAGTYLFASDLSKADAEAGEKVSYELSLDGVNGASFLLQVYDYASNAVTYKIEQMIGDITDQVDSVTVTPGSAVMQKGNTQKLTAEVLPVNTVDKAVEWSTSDEDVATVSADGVVTAVGVGTATITATSSADDTKSDTCDILVLDIDVDLNAVVWDEEGDIWLSEFNTTDMPNYDKLTSENWTKTGIASMTYDAAGNLYGVSLNSDNTSSLYSIDPVTYETTSIGGTTDVFFADVAPAPHLLNDSVLLGVYGPYIMFIDKATGDYLGVIEWGDEDTVLVGISYEGSQYNSRYGAYMDWYCLLDTDGNLYEEPFMQYGTGFAYFYGQEGALIGNTGIATDQAAYQSLYVGEDYMFISNFVEENDRVDLYAIDWFDTGVIVDIGSFADGVWPVSGLIELADTTAGTDKDFSEYADAVINSDSNFSTERIKADDKYTGGLNSVVEVTEQRGKHGFTVKVDLTATDANGVEVESTNGVQTVTWNTDDLTLRNVIVNGDYRSVNRQDADGKVTIGYVDLDGIPAGEATATLIFEAKGYEGTTIEVETEEVNNETGGTETISKPALIPGTPDGPTDPSVPVPGPGVGGDHDKPIGSDKPAASEAFPFIDVKTGDWFYDEVKQAWEKDLIDGMTATTFVPNGELTVAQAIKLAASLHQMYYTGKVTLTNGAPNWFDSYVDYAIANGIIEAKYDAYTLAQMNAPATREEFVHIFFGAMPERCYNAINDVADNAIPDVKLGDDYADEIYTFYRAGILTGSDAAGTFYPDSNIKRSEVAAILIRMFDADARQSISLK